MRNRWVTMILVLSLAMNAAVLAVAGYGSYHNSSQPTTAAGHSPEGDHHFYEKLGLTPAQLAKMTPMAAAFHESLKSLRSEMDEKKDAMISLLGGEDVAPTRIEALRKEMAAIQDGIQKTVIAHVVDVKEILDCSQRERFFDLLRRSMTQKPGMFNRAGEK
jgi:Spy/CpxP family protein refolding chaperone